MCNVQTISCAVSGLVGFFIAACISIVDSRQNGQILNPIKETTEMSRAPFFTMGTSLKGSILLLAHWIFNSHKTSGKQDCFCKARMSLPSQHQCHTEYIGCLFYFIRYFWCYISNHFLDNALAKTANIIFSDRGFLYSRRSSMAGTFTKDLKKGRGINK